MKVLITPRSFGKNNPELFSRLENAGLEVVRNKSGAILQEKKLMELIEPCEGIIVGVDPLTRQVLEHGVKLRAISKYGVGVDNIDLEYCKQKGIPVSRTVGANSNAVADYAFALALGVARKICEINTLCHEKDWKKVMGLDVCGKTLGIVGLGAIGKCVARRAKGFSMEILAFDPVWDADFASENEIRQTDIDTICKESDFITLHCILTPETRNLINKRRISLMKKNTIIINTARGELIEGNALLDALKNNQIGGAGLDVFEEEPPVNSEWYTVKNLLMGSHTSSSTFGATELMGNMAVTNLLKDLGLSI